MYLVSKRFLTEIHFCRPRVIHGLFLNFRFCLKTCLEGHTYVRLNCRENVRSNKKLREIVRYCGCKVTQDIIWSNYISVNTFN